MENNKNTYIKVRKQLSDANGFLVYAIGHWTKDGYSAKNDSANAFFYMAVENIKKVVNNNEYKSVWFSKESLNELENELSKLISIGSFYEIKQLIAAGLKYNIMEEIEHIDSTKGENV